MKVEGFRGRFGGGGLESGLDSGFGGRVCRARTRYASGCRI